MSALPGTLHRAEAQAVAPAALRLALREAAQAASRGQPADALARTVLHGAWRRALAACSERPALLHAVAGEMMAGLMDLARWWRVAAGAAVVVPPLAAVLQAARRTPQGDAELTLLHLLPHDGRLAEAVLWSRAAAELFAAAGVGHALHTRFVPAALPPQPTLALRTWGSMALVHAAGCVAPPRS